MSCTCPDWAAMCKHVAAALYGAGARLDAAPDLLFALRGVDRAELIKGVSADLPTMQTIVASERILADDDVAALFGIEIAPPPGVPRTTAKKRKAPAQRQTTLVQAAQASGPHGQETPPKASGRRTRESAEPNSLKAARVTGALAAAKKTPARENGPRTSGEARKATSAKKYVPSAAATPEEPPSQPERREGKAKAELRGEGTRAARWIGARARRARERL